MFIIVSQIQVVYLLLFFRLNKDPTWYCLKSVLTLQPLSYASVCLSFWKSVLILGIPLSQLSSKSSKVKRLFWALASCLFRAYSAHTLWESMNSDSQGRMYLYKLGMSWSSSWLMPERKCVIPTSVCFDQRRSDCGMRTWPMDNIPRPPSSCNE